MTAENVKKVKKKLKCLANNLTKDKYHESFIYPLETCILEHKFKFKNAVDVFCKPQLLPIVIKLVLKNCATITKTCSFLDCEADGITDTKYFNKEYDGGIPVTLQGSFIANFPKVIKLVKGYIDNIENSEFLFLKIAIDFYMQALDKMHPTHQITYCCLALEALFNTNSDKITKQLRDRCSELLSLTLGLNKKQISKNINKAYDTRCSYVHGQNPTCNIDDDLAGCIFDYTRFSILIILSLITNKTFIEKFKTRTPNLTFKNYINEYYLNNIDLMQNLKNELDMYLKKLAWINNLLLQKTYCRIRDLDLECY